MFHLSKSNSCNCCVLPGLKVVDPAIVCNFSRCRYTSEWIARSFFTRST